MPDVPALAVSAWMVARSRGVGEPRAAPGGTAAGWLESFDGRVDLVVVPAPGAAPVTVTADVGVTPAGAYGGGGWCWAGDDEVVVATDDRRLVVLGAQGGPVRRVLDEGASASAPTVSGGLVAFARETDAACDVAIVPLDASAWPVRASRADFARDPAWAPDGTRLAWHEWDLPAMPWDASRVAVAQVTDGWPGVAEVVAGGDGVACGQPRFAPDGRSLAYVCDRGGWMRVWVARPDGARARLLLDEEHEHAEPSWGPGQRSFAWSPDASEIALCRNEEGFGRLVAVGARRRRVRELAKGWHTGLDWGPAGILAARSGARTPTAIVLQPARAGARSVLARGPVGGFEAAGLVEPEPVTWRSGPARVHGLLYLPPGRPLGDPPPLLVGVHGGPTDQAVAEFRPEIAYWTSRGWAVLRPNYRGSTGYGRAYAQALAGRYGERDVTDTAAGIRALGRAGRVDPARVAVVGGSSAGLTVLALCARHPDLVRAGVDAFGITDLFGLAETTHRFESTYLDALVGRLPDHAARYRDRSPLTFASEIRVPVLVLQGADDPVVPRAQSDALVEAMRAAGVPVEYRVYEGEGHGFRRLESVADELVRTEAFLTRWVLRR
jgi:dipeptidyl aminopeptidase/acylaminoacyl peptidase